MMIKPRHDAVALRLIDPYRPDPTGMWARWRDRRRYLMGQYMDDNLVGYEDLYDGDDYLTGLPCCPCCNPEGLGPLLSATQDPTVPFEDRVVVRCPACEAWGIGANVKLAFEDILPLQKRQEDYARARSSAPSGPPEGEGWVQLMPGVYEKRDPPPPPTIAPTRLDVDLLGSSAPTVAPVVLDLEDE